MTRKDYVLIAQVLRNYQSDDGSTIERDQIAFDLANKFQAENPRFDRVRFLVACDVYASRNKEILAQLQD